MSESRLALVLRAADLALVEQEEEELDSYSESGSDEAEEEEEGAAGSGERTLGPRTGEASSFEPCLQGDKPLRAGLLFGSELCRLSVFYVSSNFVCLAFKKTTELLLTMENNFQ
jgi:hypothetical protein